MAERVNSYRFSKRFKKQYNALPREIRQAFDEKLLLFLADMLHPSLRVKKIQGSGGFWEGSVTMKYRFTFIFDGGTIVFRAIGTHDILLRESA
jgi:mRNA-degrading endonuclease RelE of RelBE toxin-antitoxin system